jgi:hypothetical protein
MADSTGISSPAALAQISAESSVAAATAQRADPEDPGTGGINPRTVQAKLRAAQAATTVAVGAGFVFTPEQIQTQLAQCQELSIEYGLALRKAQQAEQVVHSPAPDPAGSVLQANQTRQSLSNLTGVIQNQIDFLRNWQNTLARVKATYLRNEHLTEAQWQGLAR